ncbi:MAG: GHKL domain-containing protein, partial [Pricia sp.]|nr:GHKL domain-containing protein [Pricia sp.]
MDTIKFRVYTTRLLMWVVCLLTSCIVFSQSQITFRQLSVKEGLSQNSAISIAQDSIGYLWIATQDGLNKYDGRQFKVFPYTFVDITKPDYSHLGKVYKDREGHLWIIPLDRIPRKLDYKSQVFEPISQLNDASVLYQDMALKLWVGTYSEGLYLLNSETGIPVQVLTSSEVNGTIYNITQNGGGNLMLATDGQIVMFDPENDKIEHIHPRDNYGTNISKNFSDVVFDRSGRQWIGTFGDGLYFKQKTDAVFRRISELSFTDPLPLNLNIIDLYVDTKDRLWVATYGRGLFLIDLPKNKIVHFDAEKHDPTALHYNDILCIYEDYSGTLWFGTDGAGLSYYDEYLEKFNSLTNFQTPENINIDVVRSIAVDKNKTIWIGTSGKGLTQYEPSTNSWRTFTTEPGTGNTINSNRIMSLYADDDNDLWIGTQGDGLSIMDSNGELTHFSENSTPRISATTIWCIYKDDAGRIWLGTRENGLIEFDKLKGEINKYEHNPASPNGLTSNNIRAITADEAGNLWVGTEADGILFFDPEKETFVAYKNDAGELSLSSNNIKSLYHSPEGILWIGTNGGGLNAFDIKSGKFHSYTVEDGLANNVIYAILPDQGENLWLSSNKGISKFSPGNTLELEPEITNYTNYDGLATEFNTGASHIGEDGTLYFGGLEGFYWFKPEEIEQNKVLPKTTITGFEVFDRPQSMTNSLELKHNQNTVSFTFSSLQFSLPEKNQYQYRLLNYDEEWVQAGNTNFARYTRLPPGDYEFQVKSSNYDGVWNEKPVTYSFAIAAPWYLTSFAKMVYLILIFGLVFGVYRYLKWRWKMKIDLQLKEEEAQRLKKLNQLKSKLYTDISHEFRTPLTLIRGPVEAKLSDGRLSDSDFSNFSMIKRNTNRLIKLVDQLLHLAKLEKGKLKLKPSEGDLGLFLSMLASSFEYQASLKKMDYTVHIANLERVYYDDDAIEKIVTNLLSNAFKYGHEGGICKVEALRAGDHMQLSIKNTVEKGLELEVDKLFTRFYQQDEFSEGAGIGLSLVKQVVQLYQGEITAEIEDENIIHFQVRLPVAPEYFRKSEFSTTYEETNTPIGHDNTDSSLNSSEHSVADHDKQNVPLLLIVEDHKEVREFLKSVWGKKYRLEEAKNGKEGMEKALE